MKTLRLSPFRKKQQAQVHKACDAKQPEYRTIHELKCDWLRHLINEPLARHTLAGAQLWISDQPEYQDMGIHYVVALAKRFIE